MNYKAREHVLFLLDGSRARKGGDGAPEVIVDDVREGRVRAKAAAPRCHDEDGKVDPRLLVEWHLGPIPGPLRGLPVEVGGEEEDDGRPAEARDDVLHVLEVGDEVGDHKAGRDHTEGDGEVDERGLEALGVERLGREELVDFRVKRDTSHEEGHED